MFLQVVVEYFSIGKTFPGRVKTRLEVDFSPGCIEVPVGIFPGLVPGYGRAEGVGQRPLVEGIAIGLVVNIGTAGCHGCFLSDESRYADIGRHTRSRQQHKTRW